MYIRLYRKVDLLSRTEKRYLWLAEVNFRNCLSIIYMYTQRSINTYLISLTFSSHFPLISFIFTSGFFYWRL